MTHSDLSILYPTCQNIYQKIFLTFSFPYIVPTPFVIFLLRSDLVRVTILMVIMQKTRKKNHSFRRVAAAFLFLPRDFLGLFNCAQKSREHHTLCLDVFCYLIFLSSSSVSAFMYAFLTQYFFDNQFFYVCRANSFSVLPSAHCSVRNF